MAYLMEMQPFITPITLNRRPDLRKRGGHTRRKSSRSKVGRKSDSERPSFSRSRAGTRPRERKERGVLVRRKDISALTRQRVTEGGKGSKVGSSPDRPGKNASCCKKGTIKVTSEAQQIRGGRPKKSAIVKLNGQKMKRPRGCQERWKKTLIWRGITAFHDGEREAITGIAGRVAESHGQKGRRLREESTSEKIKKERNEMYTTMHEEGTNLLKR